MSADYITKHFKGYRHGDSVSVFRYGPEGEWLIGSFDKDDIDELASMFPEEPVPELSETDPRVYIQIAARVRNMIAIGDLPVGARISIKTLSDETCHARPTCSKALQLLVSMGLLDRKPGYGYYIVSSKDTLPRTPRMTCHDKQS